jgi:hypothetical protein
MGECRLGAPTAQERDARGQRVADQESAQRKERRESEVKVRG